MTHGVEEEIALNCILALLPCCLSTPLLPPFIPGSNGLSHREMWCVVERASILGEGQT